MNRNETDDFYATRAHCISLFVWLSVHLCYLHDEVVVSNFRKSRNIHCDGRSSSIYVRNWIVEVNGSGVRLSSNVAFDFYRLHAISTEIDNIECCTACLTLLKEHFLFLSNNSSIAHDVLTCNHNLDSRVATIVLNIVNPLEISVGRVDIESVFVLSTRKSHRCSTIISVIVGYGE